MFCQCDVHDVKRDLQPSQVVCLFEELALGERLIDYYRLPKGNRHQNFLLCTERGKLLLRVRDGKGNAAKSAVEQAVFVSLCEEIRHPVRVCDGAQENVICTLYEYEEGIELSELLPSMDIQDRRELFFVLGEKLARIHSTKSFEIAGFLNSRLEVEEPLPPLSAWFELFTNPLLVERLGEDLNNRVGYQIIRRRRQLQEMEKDICLVHGDLSGDNILIGKGILTFLDWEFVAAGHRYADIGQLFRGVGEESALRTAFESGYKSVLPLALHEEWWQFAKLRDLLAIVQLLSFEETRGSRLALLESHLLHTLNQIDR